MARHLDGADRLISLDAFRGFTIAMMLLVTDPGTYAAVYPQLLHAGWNGCTVTDLIFPSFLLAVGISLALSLGGRLKQGVAWSTLAARALRRSLLLILLGWIVNGFPYYHLSTLRLPGVLQRIGICYAAAALLYLLFSRRGSHPLCRPAGLLAAALMLLVGYWALLRFTPVPGFGPNRLDPVGYLGAYLDRAVFTVPHLWPYGKDAEGAVTYDPEGLLSTLPALATVLFGALCGDWLGGASSGLRKAQGLLVAGGMMLAVGDLWSLVLPLNKRIWTSSFGLFATGASLLIFLFFYWIVDLRGWRRGLTPLLVLGTNAIFAYTVGSLLTSLVSLARFGQPHEQPLSAWIDYGLLRVSFSPRAASLGYALLFVAANIALVSTLYRRRIFLRL